jgi:selenocysteine lyase/cysteine desulfurase
MNGTKTVDSRYYAALAGLDIVHEWVVQRIRAKSVELTGQTARARRSAWLPVGSVEGSGAAGRHRRHQRPGRAAGCAHLKAREFLVDYRPPVGVRLSPHFYNTTDEVESW